MAITLFTSAVVKFQRVNTLTLVFARLQDSHALVTFFLPSCSFSSDNSSSSADIRTLLKDDEALGLRPVFGVSEVVPDIGETRMNGVVDDVRLLYQRVTASTTQMQITNHPNVRTLSGMIRWKDENINL